MKENWNTYSKEINTTKLYKAILIIGCFLSVLTFAYFYVRNESPMYIFDYSGYFENFKLMGNLLLTDFPNFITTLITSIRTMDYNYSSVILLLPFYCLFGASRLTYIESLTLVYLFPSILLIVYSFMQIIKKNNNLDKKEELVYYTFTILLTFMYTRLWSPTLRGLSDIAGFIPIIISFILVLKKPLREKIKIRYPILLGIVVYLPFLLRRWYVYYIIGFYLSLFIMDFIYFLKSNNKKEMFIICLKNYLIAGMTTLFLAIICQLPLLKNILAQDYSNSYNGFQQSLIGHFQSFLNEFGIIILIFIILGVILSIIRKKYLKVTIFSLLNIVIFWILFGTVQNMGVHHYLGISFWVIMIVMIGIRHLYELLPKKLAYFFLILITLLFALNFCTTFIFRDTHIPIISQNNTYYKFRYNNYDELIRLINDLETLMIDPNDETAENSKFSVLADTTVISDNIIDLLGNVNIKDNIIYATHIDSRDGINFNSLFAKYIVVTNPSQLGVNSNEQSVIDIPNQMIYNEEAIGKAYTVVSGPYNLDNGVEAYIYEKTRSFTKEEVEEYLNTLYEHHSEWEKKYTYLDKVLLESDLFLGSYWGSFKRMDDDTYFFYPGGTDTTLSIPINNKLKTVKLKFYIDYSGTSLEAGIVDVSIYGDKKEIFSQTINYTDKPVEVELDLENIKNLKFIISGGEILDNDWLMMNVMELNEK